MARNNRDEFEADVKLVLAQRVGLHCSNPDCRALTSGPQDDPTKSVNIGVASHITAAAAHGPRYDPLFSTQKRKSAENGIWLCQTCSKLIDNDLNKYTVALLLEWKKEAEKAALSDLGRPGPHSVDDVDLIRFYAQCFDRAAFQDPFMREGSMEAFDKALEDTITALNTGCLRARDGGVLKQSEGKSYLRNLQWRQRMDDIVKLLRELRERYAEAVRNDEIHLMPERDGKQFHEVAEPGLVDWIDGQRSEIIDTFSVICKEAGLATLKFPVDRGRRG